MIRHARVRRFGFTLVELLVVIGVIAVLIGMLLPALNRARQSAVSVQCMANQRQIAIAIQNYATDNKGWLVKQYWDDNPNNPGMGTQGFDPPPPDASPVDNDPVRGGWVIRLRYYKYIKDGVLGTGVRWAAEGLFACPVARAAGWSTIYRSDIGINLTITYDYNPPAGFPNVHWAKITQVHQASKVYLLADAWRTDTPSIVITANVFSASPIDGGIHYRHGGKAAVRDRENTAQGATSNTDRGRAIITFVDGHGESLMQKEVSASSSRVEWRGY